MSFRQRLVQFFTTASYKRTRGLLLVLTLALAIPFTVFVSGQEQDIRQFASKIKFKKIPVPTQPTLLAFKKAIRFSSEFTVPSSVQPLSKSKPGSFSRSEQFTIEGFIRVSKGLSGPSAKAGVVNLVSLQNTTTTPQANIASLYIDVQKDQTFKPYASVLTKTNSQITLGNKNTIVLKPNRWYHLAGEFGYVYDTKDCYLALWIDGKLAEGNYYGPNECPIKLPDPQGIVFGGTLPNITLDIDEVRVTSGTLRYISYYMQGTGFPRPTEPFVSDAYTAFLWHFDDNFKDEGYYKYDLNILNGVVDFIDANIPPLTYLTPGKKKKCVQVLTPARNPQTGQCKTFPNSCIPEGWVRVSSCASR